MRRLISSLLIAGCLATVVVAGTSKEDAQSVARRFGAALTSGDASALGPILPKRGKVRVALSRLSDAQGSYGAGQVEAIFREALGRASVRAFDTARVDSDAASSALVSCRASIVDAGGRAVRVAIHLSLQPEDGAWIVREIRETPE